MREALFHKAPKEQVGRRGLHYCAPDYCCIVRTGMVACISAALPKGKGCRSCRVCTGKEDSAPGYQLGVHPLRRIAHADAFATMFVSMGGVMYYSSNIDVEGILWLGFVPIPFAYILYRRQRRKLDFQSLPTSLDKQGIYDRIYNLSVKYDWDVDHYGEDCIVAHTNPSFLRLSWGEQIFIVFDKGQIWVNSVNDLNKRTSICSFGYNKRNIRRIKEALDSDVQEVYSFAKRECASEQSADYGKNNDNQESIVSTAHTVDAESRNNPADFVELNSSDDKGIIGNGDNDLSFWSLLTPRKGNIATPLLVYINVALFIVMSVNGVSLIEPTSISLMKWGADFGPLTLTGDWWRTITCNFIHIGIMHLLMNMYALLYIGLFLEKLSVAER